MAQKKVNWPLMYILGGTLDALQLVGDLIPGVDFFVIPANEFINIAVGGALAWWGKKIGALDLTSGLAIGVTFLMEEMLAGLPPTWVADIAILHTKYKANQIKIGVAEVSGALNQGNRREPTPRVMPANQGGSRRPM